MDIRARSTYLDPHVVTLVAAIDNRLEPEDLPLAPWYSVNSRPPTVAPTVPGEPDVRPWYHGRLSGSPRGTGSAGK